MKARFIKDVSEMFQGTAILYRLESGDYIVASAAFVMFSGPETYLFKADENGKVTDWGELEGSRRGTLDIDSVMIEAGYEIQ